MLHEDILVNFEKLSNIQTYPQNMPETIRNKEIFFFTPEILTKFKFHTFCFFSRILLNCISIDIYNLSFINFLSFLKDGINDIYTSIAKSFNKFHLELKKL